MKKKKVAVDEKTDRGRSVDRIESLKMAQTLKETVEKMVPEKKWFLKDFL